MKKAVAIIVSLLFVLSVAGMSFAADKAMEKKAPVKVRQITGEVAAVDAMTNAITVKGKKAETTVVCGDKTKVMMGKEKKACADVKVGDKVTAKYTESDGKNMAKSVSIHTAKMAAKKMEKKKAEPEKPMETK